MSGTKISNMTPFTAAAMAAADLIPMVDVSAGTAGSKKATLSNAAYGLLAQITSGKIVICDASAQETANIFTDIADAFDALDDGDTLLLMGNQTYTVTPGYSEGDYSTSLAPLQLISKSNINIIGVSRPIIYGTGPGDFLWLKSCTNVYIEGVEFKGDKPNAWIMPNIFAMISLGDANAKITVNRCRFISYGDHGIADVGDEREGNSFVHIHHCYFYNGGNVSANDGTGAGINGKYFDVHDNYFEDTFRAIEMEANGAQASTNNTIHHNIIQNNYSHAICLLPSSGTSSLYTDVSIDHNIINGGGGGSSSYAAIYIAGGERISIDKNMINGYQGHGINVTPQTANGADIHISLNEVYNCLVRGIQFGTASSKTLINVSSTSDKCKYNGNSGLLISMSVSGSRDCNVSNFVGKGNSDTAGHTGAGIEVDAFATSSTIRISDCYCTDDQGTKTQNYGIWVKAGVTGAMLRDNHCIGNLTGEILDSGTSTDSAGNKTS